MIDSQNSITSAMKQLLMLKDKIALFNGLEDGDIIELIENINIMQYQKGSTIIYEGSTSNNDIFFLLQGSVEIVKIACGDDIKVAEISDAGIFGEMRALTGEARSTSIVAGNKGATVITFDIKETKDSGKTLFYKNVIGELSHKIVQMNKKYIKI